MPVWIASMLIGLGKSLLTEEVIKRVFVDFGWYLAKKSSNELDDEMVNTAAKALNYGYKPELDK